ncbi:MAG: hypothetical protein GY708_10785 [Actinomycetia bacterium]|nr:hypothetical protein [Actinomycetes bacterium]MCP4960843.1 hypothetical protein [Actinomycetes bacterium]
MISSVTPGLVSNEGSTGLGAMSTDLFLELLVAQLRHQNPMEPMDGGALLQQTSQLANVEAIQQLADLQSHVVGIGQFSTASSMIGQTVVADHSGVGEVEGVVSGVRASASGPLLQVGPYEVSIDEVVSVQATE